tara:strand:- start:208 stop:423 length:216 start_codon:yes stop_codon:yes gene_type:complete
MQPPLETLPLCDAHIVEKQLPHADRHTVSRLVFGEGKTGGMPYYHEKEGLGKRTVTPSTRAAWPQTARASQ